MSIYHSDIVDIELSSGSVFRSFANKAISEGDRSGSRYGIRPLMNGQPADLRYAACVGFFMRSDGITLVIEGVIRSGVAYVELPQAAYAKEGQFTLAVKIAGSGFTDTLRIVDGTVVNTTTGDIEDPSYVIPSLEELEAIISDAEAAADEINSLSITATQITGTRYKIAVTKE